MLPESRILLKVLKSAWQTSNISLNKTDLTWAVTWGGRFIIGFCIYMACFSVTWVVTGIGRSPCAPSGGSRRWLHRRPRRRRPTGSPSSSGSAWHLQLSLYISCNQQIHTFTLPIFSTPLAMYTLAWLSVKHAEVSVPHHRWNAFQCSLNYTFQC